MTYCECIFYRIVSSLCIQPRSVLFGIRSSHETHFINRKSNEFCERTTHYCSLIEASGLFPFLVQWHRNNARALMQRNSPGSTDQQLQYAIGDMRLTF